MPRRATDVRACAKSTSCRFRSRCARSAEGRSSVNETKDAAERRGARGRRIGRGGSARDGRWRGRHAAFEGVGHAPAPPAGSHPGARATPSRALAMRRDAVKRLQASGANRGVTRILSENVTTQRRSSSFVRGVATRLRTKAVFVLRASYTTRHITIPLLMRCRYSKARSSKRCFDLARRTRRRL